MKAYYQDNKGEIYVIFTDMIKALQDPAGLSMDLREVEFEDDLYDLVVRTNDTLNKMLDEWRLYRSRLRDKIPRKRIK